MYRGAVAAVQDEEQGHAIAGLLVVAMGVVSDVPGVACGQELAGADVAAGGASQGFRVAVDPEDM